MDFFSVIVGGMKKNIHDMTVDELTAELRRLRDNLRDLEEMHAFTFGKTSVHIGAEKAQNLQEEYEQECKEYSEQIKEIERLLNAKSARG
jgi:coenzyme F420-reducing hydrogenase alpha subunit